LTLKQLETDKKLKDELNRFRDALFQTLNELKVKLNDKQSKKMDKVECNVFYIDRPKKYLKFINSHYKMINCYCQVESNWFQL